MRAQFTAAPIGQSTKSFSGRHRGRLELPSRQCDGMTEHGDDGDADDEVGKQAAFHGFSSVRNFMDWREAGQCRLRRESGG
jgi:hypothetical protein